MTWTVLRNDLVPNALPVQELWYDTPIQVGAGYRLTKAVAVACCAMPVACACGKSAGQTHDPTQPVSAQSARTLTSHLSSLTPTLTPPLSAFSPPLPRP